jgi:hypothetical protein
MKIFILVASAAALLTTGVVAQTTTRSTSEHDSVVGTSHNPAIKNGAPVRTGMAADGANSFTEKQARRRLTDTGYANVNTLVKDKNGVWRGTATKGGAQVQVGLDYKGNVVTR